MLIKRIIKKAITEMARLFGFNLIFTDIRHDAKNRQKGYEPIRPGAGYAPWLLDEQFSRIYEVVKENTLVDKYRCYELWQMVKESAKLEGALVEVGVWRGGTSALIAKSAELNGIKDTVYLCDTFSGVVKAGENDLSYVGGEHADTSKKIVESLVGKLGLKNVKILEGIFPNDTAAQITANNIRFCHIDVDVYESAQDIVNWVWPKLVSGGMIIFDDYGFMSCSGITKFVNEEKNKKDRLVIYNLNGHAIIIKI